MIRGIAERVEGIVYPLLAIGVSLSAVEQWLRIACLVAALLASIRTLRRKDKK